jgi:hypothetical protein
MEESNHLDGEVPEGQIGVRDGDGLVRNPSHVIFPIVSFINGVSSLVGTGFFIGPNGLFASAKHVLMDVVDQKTGVPKGELFIVQFLDNDVAIQRPVHRFSTREKADVGVGVCWQMKNNSTGLELKNSQLRLTLETPTLNTKVSTYAYPKTKKFKMPDGQQALDFIPAFFDGTIEEHHPDGRDKSILPAECFRTNMHIHSGASGGPAFNIENNTGKVFGINSTGFEKDNISYVSSIKDILKLDVTGVKLSSDGPEITLKITDLINEKQIRVS